MPEDRDVVAVWQDEQRQIHKTCGMARWQWDDSPWYVDHDTCPFCEQVDGYRRQLTEGHSKLDGVYIGFWRTPRED